MRNQYSRRKVLGIGSTAALGTFLTPVASIAKAAITVTPQQTEGPFYPIHQQADKDVDLTHMEGKTEKAQGKVIRVSGKVYDESGKIISGAFVEIWQANKFGRYRHIKDPSNAPLDPAFQGWGQAKTTEKGEYGFKTILPGAYPAGRGWVRPPHIHFKVKFKGHKELITQMYFPDEKLNDRDLILQRFSTSLQHLVVAKRTSNENSELDDHFLFDIYLKKSNA